MTGEVIAFPSIRPPKLAVFIVLKQSRQAPPPVIAAMPVVIRGRGNL